MTPNEIQAQLTARSARLALLELVRGAEIQSAVALCQFRKQGYGDADYDQAVSSLVAAGAVVVTPMLTLLRPTAS